MQSLMLNEIDLAIMGRAPDAIDWTDELVGGSGNDTISANDGGDMLNGGAGVDRLFGGKG